jgi:3-methylcrotonyl-CoA carboxylase alpha subunit
LAGERFAPAGLPGERFSPAELIGGRIAPAGSSDERLALELEGVRLEATAVAEGAGRWMTLRGVHVFAISRDPAGDLGAGGVPDAERLQAPLPGKVIQVAVQSGQTVAAGDVLVVLEAMKVEHQITAPHAGRVKALRFKEGDLVQRGDPLVELE